MFVDLPARKDLTCFHSCTVDPGDTRVPPEREKKQKQKRPFGQRDAAFFASLHIPEKNSPAVCWRRLRLQRQHWFPGPLRVRRRLTLFRCRVPFEAYKCTHTFFITGSRSPSLGQRVWKRQGFFSMLMYFPVCHLCLPMFAFYTNPQRTAFSPCKLNDFVQFQRETDRADDWKDRMSWNVTERRCHCISTLFCCYCWTFF